VKSKSKPAYSRRGHTKEGIIVVVGSSVVVVVGASVVVLPEEVEDVLEVLPEEVEDVLEVLPEEVLVVTVPFRIPASFGTATVSTSIITMGTRTATTIAMDAAILGPADCTIRGRLMIFIE
jgi:hypothetical protein